MTISTSSSLLSGTRFSRVLGAGLSLALASAASGMSVHVRTAGSCPEHFRSRESLGSAPGYLIAVGPSAFRFAAPPPVATERPAPPAPVAAPVIATTPVAVTPAPLTKTPIDDASAKPAKPGPKAIAILPDDTPSEVHPEDILPYFKLPKGGEKGSTDVPFTPASPSTQPRSSASYELQ